MALTVLHRKTASPTPASVRGAAVFICFSLQTGRALGSLTGPKGAAWSFQGMREKEKAEESGVRSWMSLGIFFFENEKPLEDTPRVLTFLSHCRCFLFYQMNMEVLKCTSVFVLCLILQAHSPCWEGSRFSVRLHLPFPPVLAMAASLWDHVLSAFDCKVEYCLICIFIWLLSLGCERSVLLSSTPHFCPQMSTHLKPSKESVLETAICLLFQLDLCLNNKTYLAEHISS